MISAVWKGEGLATIHPPTEVWVAAAEDEWKEGIEGLFYTPMQMPFLRHLIVYSGIVTLSPQRCLLRQGEQKERFNAIQQELSQLSTKFSNNVLDSTKAFKKLITDASDLDGVPPSALSLFAQQATTEGHKDATAEKGPWLLTLVPPHLPGGLLGAAHRKRLLDSCNSQGRGSGWRD